MQTPHGWCDITAVRFEVTEGTARALTTGADYSPLALGILTTVMFLAILTTLSRRLSALRLPGSQQAGALTYPLYLLHAHVGYMLLDAYGTEANKWAMYAAITGLVLALAWALHVLVERRPKSFWYRFFDRIAGVAAQASPSAEPITGGRWRPSRP